MDFSEDPRNLFVGQSNVAKLFPAKFELPVHIKTRPDQLVTSSFFIGALAEACEGLELKDINLQITTESISSVTSSELQRALKRITQ